MFVCLFFLARDSECRGECGRRATVMYILPFNAFLCVQPLASLLFSVVHFSRIPQGRSGLPVTPSLARVLCAVSSWVTLSHSSISFPSSRNHRHEATDGSSPCLYCSHIYVFSKTVLLRSFPRSQDRKGSGRCAHHPTILNQ